MQTKLTYLVLAMALIFTACDSKEIDINEEVSTKAKFEPADDKCILFIGQDMGAIGGLPEYNNGYANHFPAPAGITVYTNFHTRREDGLAGIFSKGNWGAGDCYADQQIKAPSFTNSALAIGLEIVDSEQDIVEGKADDMIKRLGVWMQDLAPRPIFLRIGYEFDGHAWNHYSLNYYPKAWRYIVDSLTAMGVDNVAYVWQSMGSATSAADMEEWYPGDRYVDWCGYSYFNSPDEEMIKFARLHNKPVFIAEATPVLKNGEDYTDTDLSNNTVAQQAWDDWFAGLFKTIEDNGDVVKALSYINVEWLAQDMWITNPTFQKVDSRIQESEFLTVKWLEKINTERYLKPTEDFWQELNN